MSSNYIGYSPDQILAGVENRYFYGIRRTDQGELFLAKVDQVKTNDSIVINKSGDSIDNFSNFREGDNFFEGRNVLHEKVYENLNYEQFQWSNKNIYYYVNEQGELVARINQSIVYDENSSSEGIE